MFFENLSKNNFLIKWNINSYVIENYDVSRENFSWFIKRNLRYGYSGNVIDKKIYNEKAYVVIFIKILILIFLSSIYILIPKKKNFIKSIFYFARAIGRIMKILNYKPKKYI